MMGIVYALCEPDTGEVRYIGKTCQPMLRRLNGHIQHARKGKRVHRDCWLRTLDRKPRVLLLETGVFTRWQLNALECEWIRYGRRLGWNLTNATDGGDGGKTFVMTAADRARISAAHKGKPKSAEHRAKIGLANRGPNAKKSAAMYRRWEERRLANVC